MEHRFLRVFDVIIVSFVFVYWLLVWSYVSRLEQTGCECSRDWRREYIRYYAILMLAIILAAFTTTIHNIAITVVLVLLNAVFLIAVFQYIHRLKREKCECSQAVTRDVMEIVNLVQIVLFSVGIFLLILMAVHYGLYHK